MEYKDDFFQAYRKYLDDPSVRRQHDKVFDLFTDRYCPPESNVSDYGCGTAEFGRYLASWYRPLGYVGVDLDLSRVDCSIGAFHVGNYNSPLPPGTNAVVSLFAAELHLPADERSALYDRWIASGVRAILTSGFYYHHCPLDDLMAEKTGYTCFQTTPLLPIRPDELRLQTVVPPGMFNDPYTEVWRIICPPRVEVESPDWLQDAEAAWRDDLARERQ